MRYILDIFLYIFFLGQGHCLLLLFVNVMSNMFYIKIEIHAVIVLNLISVNTISTEQFLNVFSLSSQHGLQGGRVVANSPKISKMV